jgi:hypothetical protein
MTDSSQTIPAKKSGKTARKVIMMRTAVSPRLFSLQVLIQDRIRKKAVKMD